MKASVIVVFLIPLQFFSQEFEIGGTVESKTILATKDENPFWFHTNTNNSLGELSNLSATAELKSNLSFSSFKLNAGVAIYGRDGVEDAIQRRDLYIQFENSWLLATIGAKKQTEVLDGLSSTNQNFLWSGNARPLPGLLLEANNPIKISKAFALDWGIAHYEMNDDRFVDGTHLHYKRLALITRFNENNKLTAKIQHYAQWGGTSPVYGNLKDGAKDFVNMFFAHTTSEVEIDNEILNKLGNHLGTYFLEYKTKNKLGEFSIYLEHPFEDGSGSGLKNFPDGVYGIHFKPINQSIISSILYEYITTTDQSGLSGGSGRDSYFSNGIYRSGWTYEENIIGAPFILFDKNVEIDGGNTAFISNRSEVHNIGVAGGLNKFQWKLKSTYAKYLGTYSRPFTPEWKSWYNFGSLSYKTTKIGIFTIICGADFSNISQTILGGGLAYSYSF
ncbi:capsule assembly Wzi family protein [Aequorivita lipolytica]|nr:capsule assembly Wzi family protein [Aequorivita lipolytica]SRX53665.1 hypothetical protein AEQU2_02897 [Aequorivita lipolytica]